MKHSFYLDSRSIKVFLLLLSGAIFLASCQKKELELTPVTSISEADAYNTPEKILAQVNGLYGQLSSPSLYGGRYIVFNEQRGDEFSQNDGNNSTGANVWNQSISGSGDFVNAVWNAAYRTINSANILIEQLQATDVVDEESKKNYLAEARFIRAFIYFSLVQTYAKPYNLDPQSLAIPLRLGAETSGGNNDMAFSTVSQVYEQIIRDLDAAEQDLPVSYPTPLLTVSRAHRATAIALKTRVYLTQSNWDRVVIEASKLVPETPPFQYEGNGVIHGLESNFATIFGGSYMGREALFSIPFIIPSEAPGQQAALAYNYLSPVLYLNSEGIVAHPVFASPTSTDSRKTLVIKNAVGQQLVNKFSRNGAPYTDYIPLIRYAEVLLNYAEAAARKNETEKAIALLNAVRHRADPTFVFISSIGSPEELVETIFTEKRIELLGEGFRTHELFRKVLPLPAKQGNAGTAPEIQPTASNYTWPIPSGELAYNKLAPR